MRPRLSVLTATLLCALASCASSGAAPRERSTSPEDARRVLVDTSGARHDLGAVLDSGRQVALVFWQPWCESCREEAPVIARAHGRLARGVEFVGVVPGPDEVVDDGAIRAAIAQWGMPFATVRDRDLALTRAFGVEGTPTIVIVAPDGSVAYQAHVPPVEWRE